MNFQIKGGERHAIIVERTSEGIKFIDPQFGRGVKWSIWKKRCDFSKHFNVLRIDDKALNADIAKFLVKNK